MNCYKSIDLRRKIMKKQMKSYVILIVFLIVIVSCGCTEKNSNNSHISGDSDKIQIITYSIETQKHTALDMGDWIKIHDNFSYSEDAERYFISGTIKNIAGYMLSRVNITANFFDNTDQFLDSVTTSIDNLGNMNVSNFEISYWDHDLFFQNVDHVKFNIIAT